MSVTTRRAILAAPALLMGGTVAARAALRKPPHPIRAPLGDPNLGLVSLQGMDTLVPTVPARPVAPVGFMDGGGVAHRLSDFAGRGVVLNLWATWCMPCVAELPGLENLARLVAAEGIVVLPLSSDRGGAATVTRFLASRGLADLPVLLDQGGAAGRALAARGVPTTVIVDRNGRERARLEGGADWASHEAVATIRRLVG